MRVDAGFDQAAADGLLDLWRVRDEGVAFGSVGATTKKRVAGFFRVV